MTNAFDSANYPQQEPQALVAGDRWLWKRTDLGSDYPPASYSLKYSARLLSGDDVPEIEITATGSGADYLIEVASATTAAVKAGRYRWQAYITRTSDSQRINIGAGTFEVTDNLDASTADPRTHARKVLDAIEAVIEKRAGMDQMMYMINGRQLSRTPIRDLITLRDLYRAEVGLEERKASGRGGAKLLVRL